MNTLTVLSHDRAKSNVTTLHQDEDFGDKAGSIRFIKITIPPLSAFHWHYHTGMHETFIAGISPLSVTLLQEGKNNAKQMNHHTISSGETLPVTPKTPHFIANETKEETIAFALQVIEKGGGETVHIDFGF